MRCSFDTVLAVAAVTAVALGCSRRAVQPQPAGLESIRQMLTAPEEQIDLAKAKLIIDRVIDPSIDVANELSQLDAIAQQVRSRLPASATSHEKIEALRAQLYEAGPWNDNQPFRYDMNDPFGHTIHNKLLATYLATKKGNCVSMPMLFIVLGQRLGIDVTAATAPEHIFVKYRDEAGALYNLETTSGAGFTSDGWIQRQMPMTPESLANGIYLRRLSKMETVVVMLGTLMEFYGQQNRQQERIELAQVALEYSPKDVSAMLHIHSAYGRLVQQNFESKYALTTEIPLEQRAYFRQLNDTGQLWRRKAEELGWREPTEATNAQYEETVNAARAAQ